MRYELHTTVDITSTGQFRAEPGKETDHWKEQNFQTVLQTLGIRANVTYSTTPVVGIIKGDILGFNTSKLIKVWTFNFETERDFLYNDGDDPTGLLKDDFELVPYISGLDECMKQSYDVFVTYGQTRNIVFYKN